MDTLWTNASRFPKLRTSISPLGVLAHRDPRANSVRAEDTTSTVRTRQVVKRRYCRERRVRPRVDPRFGDASWKQQRVVVKSTVSTRVKVFYRSIGERIAVHKDHGVEISTIAQHKSPVLEGAIEVVVQAMSCLPRRPSDHFHCTTGRDVARRPRRLAGYARRSAGHLFESRQ